MRDHNAQKGKRRTATRTRLLDGEHQRHSHVGGWRNVRRRADQSVSAAADKLYRTQTADGRGGINNSAQPHRHDRRCQGTPAPNGPDRL